MRAMGGRVGRSQRWYAVVGVVLTGIFGAVVNLATSGFDVADRKWWLTVAAVVLLVVLVAVTYFQTDSGSLADWDNTVEAEAARLASEVERRGSAQRARYGSSLLQLRFRLAPAKVVGQLPNVRVSAYAGAFPTTNLDGRLDDIADVYRRSTGWLVVLGGPGAGKSVLARHLVVRLMETRKPDEVRIPVVFPVHTWDPDVEFEKWLAQCLMRDFNGLKREGPGGTNVAAALVEHGHILPILDGFDEIPQRRLRDALRELNHAPMPLVLLSRTETYAELVKEGVALRRADVIALDDLTLRDLRRALPTDTRTEAGRAKWDVVLDPLSESGDAGGVSALASPLMVSLARAVYEEPGENPADMLESSGRRLRDAEELKSRLLARFVSTVYRRQSPWRPENAERWLGYLARTNGPGDFAWWKLVDSVPRRHRVGAFLVLGAVLGAAAGGLRLGWTGLVLGALIVGVLGALIGWSQGPEPERMDLKLSGRAKHALAQVVPGVVGGLIVGIVGFFLVGQWGWWTLGVAGALGNAVGDGLTGWARHRAWNDSAKPILKEVGLGACGGAAGASTVGAIGALSHAPTGQNLPLWLLAGLIVGVAFTPGAGLLAEPEVEVAVTPTALLRSNRRYAVLQTIMVTITFGLAIGIFTGIVNGFVFGCAIGAAFGVGAHAWGRWLIIGRVWLPLTGRLPFRKVWRFLEDAQERGLLRQRGAFYEFRHALLRDTVAARYAASSRTRFWSD
ncbi:NACHT domain-containing protein [Micromonospora profundi]|uniref:NACHT domain-containing protein n=1 Tax=Micromonospora profundi TaxID=1420889 RepID=UPI002FF201EF